MHDVIMVTGHQPYSPGAANMNGPGPDDDVYEYHFNDPIVAEVVSLLTVKGIDAVHSHYADGWRNWNGASKLLVECHCNAFNGKATGTEVLYANGSTRGAVAAKIMQERLVKELGLVDRGIKSKVRSDRGGYLLWGVSQVALIPEPGFIDNDHDLARMKKQDMAGAYADAVERILAEVL